jgi:hypothetical protein
VKSRISGKEAVYMARESERRLPVKLLASDRVDGVSVDPLPSETADEGRKAPPRVPKRSRFHDQCMAPTPDLESHRTRLRKAFGNSCRMTSSTFAERCLACGGREYGYDPLLPYGVEPTGHAWLHSRCWEAWHAGRKREAAAALKAMGVGKPTATE